MKARGAGHPDGDTPSRAAAYATRAGERKARDGLFPIAEAAARGAIRPAMSAGLDEDSQLRFERAVLASVNRDRACAPKVP